MCRSKEQAQGATEASNKDLWEQFKLARESLTAPSDLGSPMASRPLPSSQQPDGPTATTKEVNKDEKGLQHGPTLLNVNPPLQNVTMPANREEQLTAGKNSSHPSKAHDKILKGPRYGKSRTLTSARDMVESNKSEEITFRRHKSKRGSKHPKPNSGRPKAQTEKKRTDKEKQMPNKIPTPPQHPKKIPVVRRKATEATMEELRRVRAEAMAQVGLNRYREEDLLDTQPEILKKLRDGEGTDPTSAFSKRIAERLMVGYARSEGEDYMATPLPLIPNFDFYLKSSPPDEDEIKDIRLWKEYSQDTSAYPKVENGAIILYSGPLPEHLALLHQQTRFSTEVFSQPGDDMPAEQPFDDPNLPRFNIWPNDTPVKPAVEGFDCFLDKWLDETMHKVYIVDIYHKSFFDGDAHPDGHKSMFLPGSDCEPTYLDEDDEQTRLHSHETADGYRFNYLQMLKRERAAKQLDRLHARTAYLEAARTSCQSHTKAPIANIYLRPAEISDVAGVLEIHNWYVEHSIRCIETDRVQASVVEQKIRDCGQNRLPFIVAVERRIGIPRGNFQKDPVEKVLGYCFGSPFTSSDLTINRFTAEVKIFVEPKSQNQGVGRCLIDKFLDICDPLYDAQRGYFFDSDEQDRVLYASGGARQLTRLIIAFSSERNDQEEYSRVKTWLGNNFEFEEQGILKGAANKFDKVLDVMYLVRTCPSLGSKTGM